MIAQNPNAAQAPNCKGANKHPGVKKGVKGFLKGKSGNSAGRPPGSRCQATLMAQALFDDKGQAIVEKITDRFFGRKMVAMVEKCDGDHVERLKALVEGASDQAG